MAEAFSLHVSASVVVEMSAKLDKRIRNLLVKQELVAEQEVNTLCDEAQEKGSSLPDLLIERNLLTAKQIISAIAQDRKYPPIDLAVVSVDEETRNALPKDLASYYGVVPVSKLDGLLTLAIADPFDVMKLDDIRLVTGCELRPVVTLESMIQTNIDRIYDTSAKKFQDMVDSLADPMLEEVKTDDRDDAKKIDLSEDSEDSGVVKIVNLVIYQAVKKRASDIHIEPMEKEVQVRYRMDGMLHIVQTLPGHLKGAIASRIKVLADLDIAEKRVPQDGKCQLRIDGRSIDFRVSTLPLVHGEKAVLRILDSGNLALSLDVLGFEPKSLTDLRDVIAMPYGMILVTGPTGSGKTTTLYSCLKEIVTDEDNVITVEDPVEYQMPAVNQVQVSAKRGLTFAAALRSILRQDPDKIMIGEIRDLETVSIAIKAALTGHLVLSTLHTNDAPSTITRLIDMGVDPFNVTSSLLLVCAQRLMRKICGACGRPVDPKPADKLTESGFTAEDLAAGWTLLDPVGCGKCTNGYKGRFAILETLRLTDDLRRIILGGANDLQIRDHGIAKDGMVTLRRGAMLNVMRGKTTLAELNRATRM